MVAPVSHIQPNVTLRRKRLLPGEGTVLVNVGDVVRAGDAVARSSLEARHVSLDAARSLGVASEKAKDLILRSVGEEVDAGAIIAGRRGVGNRQLRAPASGKIVAISEAHILLQISDDSSLLPARVPGEVIDIELGRGVTIECVCAWMQARWGNGHVGDGSLQIIGESSDQNLTPDLIDMGQRGIILVAGNCEQRQALEIAAQVPIRGLILGSLATKLYPLANKLPFPLVITEGFGKLPMNTEAYKLLTKHNGQQATLNAQKTDAFSDDRPEVIIPLKEAGKPPQTVLTQNFRVGQTVRILTGADRGKTGIISALLSSSTFYESGLHAPGASVNLGRQGLVQYPLVNLELLG